MRGEAANPEYLYQIVLCCEYIKQIVAELEGDFDKFTDAKGRKDRDLSAFYAGQIGEYANKLTAQFKAEHGEIIWHQIVAMRNRIFHDYRSVRQDILWEIMIEEVPRLGEQCLRILSELDPNASTDIQEEIESLRSNNGG